MRTFGLCLFLLANAVQAKQLDLKTTLTDVTVFHSGAQVKRVGSLTIPAGEHDIVIRDATSLLKRESIQVKGEGNFTILSVNHQVNLADQSMDKQKIAELEAKEKNLMRQMEDLSVKIEVLRTEEAVVNNFQYVSTTTEGITVEQVSKAQELLRVKMAVIKNDKLVASRQMQELYDQHQEVVRQLTSIRMPKQNVSYEIVITVLAKAETKAEFTLGYIVPNAKWYPTYDIRVKDVSSPMVIEYKANVTQQSGEDWKDVKLKLSTGDPSESSQKPTVSTWLLYLNQNYVQPQQRSNYYRYTDAKYSKVSGTVLDRETGEVIPFASVMVYGTNIGAATDMDGNFSLVLPENATQLQVSIVGYQQKIVPINSNNLKIYLQGSAATLSEVSVISDEEYEKDTDGKYDLGLGQRNQKGGNGRKETSSVTGWDFNDGSSGGFANAVTVAPTLNVVNTEFVIDEKYTILSDPKNIMVAIQSIETKANYQYYCAPRLEKDVFLTAQLTNWEQYNLLEGEANVFFEGTFIGNTLLDTRFLTDTLEISLGRDKSVKVERKKSKEFNKRQTLGSNNIAYRHWDIAVRNGKQQPINIMVEDQFPLSADSKIDVKRESYGNGKLNDKTGIVTWEFNNLVPSETKNMELKYSAKYPKGSFIGLD